jgi:hypothetical protein
MNKRSMLKTESNNFLMMTLQSRSLTMMNPGSWIMIFTVTFKGGGVLYTEMYGNSLTWNLIVQNIVSHLPSR